MQAVHGYVEPRLVAIAVADVAHAQAGGVRLVGGVAAEVRELEIAALEERLAHHRRYAEQIQHDPAVAPIVAQQIEVARGDEIRAALAGLAHVRIRFPERQRERIVEMHARDGLHHAAVAQAEALAVNRLHAPDVRGAVLRDRNVRVALDGPGHARRPQQLIAQVAVDELVQVEQVLQQLPARRESGRHQLDQRFGIIRRDVLVGERRSERARVRGLRQAPHGRDPQRLLLHTLAPALQQLGLTAVDERGEAPLEDAIDCEIAHEFATSACGP